MPNIIWRLNGKIKVNKELNILEKEGHPFSISTSINGDATVSELRINTAGQCLSGNIISCWVINHVQSGGETLKIEHMIQSFTIKPGKRFLKLQIILSCFID